jgi:hypothetical protein
MRSPVNLDITQLVAANRRIKFFSYAIPPLPKGRGGGTVPEGRERIKPGCVTASALELSCQSGDWLVRTNLSCIIRNRAAAPMAASSHWCLNPLKWMHAAVTRRRRASAGFGLGRRSEFSRNLTTNTRHTNLWVKVGQRAYARAVFILLRLNLLNGYTQKSVSASWYPFHSNRSPRPLHGWLTTRKKNGCSKQ